MADETETAKVAGMVDPMGDTVPMPDLVRQCVRQVQERLHRNHELELDPAGFFPVPTVGPRSTAPAMSDYRQPRVRFDHCARLIIPMRCITVDSGRARLQAHAMISRRWTPRIRRM